VPRPSEAKPSPAQSSGSEQALGGPSRARHSVARLALKKTPAQAMKPIGSHPSPAIGDSKIPAPAVDADVPGRSAPPADPVGARLLLAAHAFKEGKRHLGADAPKRALSDLLRAVALQPDSVEYNLYLGWAEFLTADGEAQGIKLASLKQLASQSIQKEPTFAFAHFVLGRVATLEGLERTGARFFRRALELEPGMAEAERYLRLLAPRVDAPPAVTHEVGEDPSVTHEPGPGD
jgi:hypothetical protein